MLILTQAWCHNETAVILPMVENVAFSKIGYIVIRLGATYKIKYY